MKFFHVYNELCFEGLVKNGLLNQDSGFKIQHIFRLTEDMKFNRLAAKGSKLHQMIQEGNIPFYVDRIAGGTTYHKYEFDRELIREYEDLLGDWFLGFQLHESGSNRRMSDWKNIISAMGHKGPYDADKMREVLKNPLSFLPDGTQLMKLSQDPIEEYAKRQYVDSAEEFIEEMKDMFQRRMEEVDGHILPCDSYYLASWMQDKLGMKSFMPEVGCQIPQMRQEVALARGIAKASKKTWGTYYECWREIPGIGYCMPCYNDYPLNEWYNKPAPGKDDFWSRGENGGSSRLLQHRIYYYALMSGADYFSEEWGLNCSYSDMEDFTLSPYGELKKAFINDALNYQGVKAITPFAIVLPKEYASIELPDVFSPYVIGQHKDTYLDSPLSAEEKAFYGHVEDVLKLIYAREEIIGNEGHVLTNSRFGDVMDIIYEDASEEALAAYDYLIDASPDGGFVASKKGCGLTILESKDLEELEVRMQQLIKEKMPCYVDDLCWLVSVDENDRRMLSIFNNEGNERSLEKGDTVAAEADRRVKVTFKEAVDLRVLKEAPKAVEIQKVDDYNYYVLVPAAGFVILQF